MDNSQNSIKAFTDAIKRMAQEECKAINNETRQIKSQRLEALLAQTQEKYNDLVNYELSRIQADKNRQISIMNENTAKELSHLRSELTDKVFAAVVEELLQYTKTEDYKQLLIRSVKEILGALGDEELEFFLRKEDLPLAGEICKAIDKKLDFKAADDIKLGGVKAIGRKTESLADNTLDLKLEAQKEWFFANSGFEI